VKLHHLEAEMEAPVVPAVLAYKGGELFANIMRIVDEIPPGRNLSTDSLELVLRRYASRFSATNKSWMANDLQSQCPTQGVIRPHDYRTLFSFVII
jgi:hypothetical protein